MAVIAMTRTIRSQTGLVALILAVVLAGCSEPAEAERAQTPHTPPSRAGAAAPSDHVHGAAFNAADGKLYLATHEGLFRYYAQGPTSVGPELD